MCRTLASGECAWAEAHLEFREEAPGSLHPDEAAKDPWPTGMREEHA